LGRIDTAMLNRIVRLAAPILILGAALGAFLAASYALGASDDDRLSYAVGISFQVLAVASVTAWLSSIEHSDSRSWARTHARHACLLYIVTVALIMLWPNAGHASGVVKFTAVLAAAGLAANAVVLYLAGRPNRGVAA
jgi:hypothetical protein